MASQTSDMAGDGTTTATVLAHAIFQEGLRAIAAGMDPMDLKRGIDRASAAAVGALKRISVPCKDTKAIAQVAAISANSDQADGVRILLRAVEEPLRQIAGNGGGNPSVVLSAIRKDTGNFGFNTATEQYGGLVTMGVVDPTKVTRLALQNAASIAGLLLTTEVAAASLRPDAGHAGGIEGAM